MGGQDQPEISPNRPHSSLTGQRGGSSAIIAAFSDRPTIRRRVPFPKTTQAAEVAKRRTFAIISHPDAGKTTITEKLLLMGQAIAVAGTVKSRKSDRHATSDWMEMEKQRGISITTW